MDNRYPRPGTDNKISSDIIVNEFGGIQKIADGLKSNMKVSIINIHFSSFMTKISMEIWVLEVEFDFENYKFYLHFICKYRQESIQSQFPKDSICK